MRRFKKRAKVKREAKNSDSLPQACSCGCAVSDTSGRGREEEGGGSVSVDCGAQRQQYNQSFELALTKQIKYSYLSQTLNNPF